MYRNTSHNSCTSYVGIIFACPFRSAVSTCFSLSSITPNDLYATVAAVQHFHLNRFPVHVIIIYNDDDGDSRDRYQVFKQFKGAPRTTKITYCRRPLNMFFRSSIAMECPVSRSSSRTTWKRFLTTYPDGGFKWFFNPINILILIIGIT